MKKIIFNVSILITVLITTGIISGCVFSNGTTGSGNVISQSRPIEDFTSLKVEDAYTVVLSQGDSSSVIVIADDNFMPYIKTEVSGGELKIYNDKSFVNIKSLKVLVKFKKIDEILGEGAVKFIRSDSNALRFENLKIKLEGASDVSMRLQADELSVNSEGASTIILSGNCNKQTADIEGAGTYKAYDLVSNEADMDITGAGDAYLNVTQKLTAKCTGAGKIRYKGEPAVKEFSSVGASSIEPAQ